MWYWKQAEAGLRQDFDVPRLQDSWALLRHLMFIQKCHLALPSTTYGCAGIAFPSDDQLAKGCPRCSLEKEGMKMFKVSSKKLHNADGLSLNGCLRPWFNMYQRHFRGLLGCWCFESCITHRTLLCQKQKDFPSHVFFTSQSIAESIFKENAAEKWWNGWSMEWWGWWNHDTLISDKKM